MQLLPMPAWPPGLMVNNGIVWAKGGNSGFGRATIQGNFKTVVLGEHETIEGAICRACISPQDWAGFLPLGFVFALS